MRVLIYCTSEHEKLQAQELAGRMPLGTEVIGAGVPFGPSLVATTAMHGALPVVSRPQPVAAAWNKQPRAVLAFISKARHRRFYRRARRVYRAYHELGFLFLARIAIRKALASERVPRVVASPTRQFGAALARLLVRWTARAGAAVVHTGWVTFLSHYRRAGALKGLFSALLDDLKPDVVVLLEDNVGGLTRIVAATASGRAVPYVVLPLTIPNPKEPAAFYRGEPSHSIRGTLARLVARRWPKWVYEDDSGAMLRLPAAEIVSMHRLRLDPPEPWILNSGGAEAICIESPAMLRHYRALRFPERQLVVTGSLIDDTLHAARAERDQRRTALCAELGLEAGRPLFLVGFPPDQYTSPNTSPFEWASFDALVEGWLHGLKPALTTANVVIKPHPRLSRSRLAAFEAAGMPVVVRRTEELVPLCDVYIASISATIRWALALGIPVVNYDCYRYRYGDYDSASGQVTVENFADFASAISALASDCSYRLQLTLAQKADAANWGIIDGCFMQRFEHLLARTGRSRGDQLAAGGMSIGTSPRGRSIREPGNAVAEEADGAGVPFHRDRETLSSD